MDFIHAALQHDGVFVVHCFGYFNWHSNHGFNTTDGVILKVELCQTSSGGTLGVDAGSVTLSCSFHWVSFSWAQNTSAAYLNALIDLN
jgi:hypothetical protein